VVTVAQSNGCPPLAAKQMMVSGTKQSLVIVLVFFWSVQHRMGFPLMLGHIMLREA
jgi:hypothetical protein